MIKVGVGGDENQVSYFVWLKCSSQLCDALVCMLKRGVVMGIRSWHISGSERERENFDDNYR